MSNLIAGSTNGAFSRLRIDKLEVISVLINNHCNLSCKHCYLQTRAFENYLSHDEWMRFFHSLFSELQPAILCFAGKEVFLNQKSVSILIDAIKLRNEIQTGLPATEIGVITNGTLVHKFRDRLLNEAAPDYIDVSVDGLPVDNDAVRGAGCFKQLAPNLRWLKYHFAGSMWITHTLLSSNLRSLPEFVEFYHQKYDITKFSLGIYKPQSYTDLSLTIKTEDYLELAEYILPALEHLSLNTAVTVNMELDTTQLDLIKVLSDTGWADPLDPISITSHKYSNGLTLNIHTTRIPTGLWRAVRITPEGYWLAVENLVRVREYQQTKVANLREYNFDARRIYEYGLSFRPSFELRGSNENSWSEMIKSANHHKIVTSAWLPAKEISAR